MPRKRFLHSSFSLWFKASKMPYQLNLFPKAFISCMIFQVVIAAEVVHKKKDSYLITDGAFGDTVKINDNKENCQKVPFKQLIIKDGCQKAEVTNYICVGHCKTSYIPFRSYSKHKKSSFKCNSCVPSKYKVYVVPLVCENRKKIYRFKKILLVDECECKISRCEAKWF